MILDSTWDSRNRVVNGVLIEGVNRRRYFDISISDLSKTHNIKLYELRQFTITYHLDGGINPSGHQENDDTYYESNSIDLYPPSKSGYTFVGWFTDSDYRNKVNRFESGTIGDLTLYAKWVKNQVIQVPGNIKKIYGCSTFNLKAKAQGKLTYSSNNQKIATVNNDGKVTIKSTGKVTITIKAEATDLYSASATQVTIIVRPKAMTLSSVKPSSKGKIVVKWKKDKMATGYEITYAKNNKLTSEKKIIRISKNSTVKKSLTKMKSGKKYYVRIRAYKTIDGKKTYGDYSRIKSATVK